ncbi:MAG: hypothetical protein DDT19_00233 [Syntrophomonadaceae bacterium]|nr:hypothetical protein [Bacillota bacterium]
MSRYYSLGEVKGLRDEISKLGERKFPLLETELNKAMTELNKAMAEQEKTKAELNKAGAERDKIRAQRDKAIAEYDIKLFTLLVVICPEAYYRGWDGYLLIPKDEDEEWIIPIFTGAYREIKHTAFSIWTIPKGSCDEKLAREVKADE